MGECKINGEARTFMEPKEKECSPFMAVNDPEDYQHRVLGDAPTVLDLSKLSGYRLILNNVLFPVARKKN